MSRQHFSDSPARRAALVPGRRPPHRLPGNHPLPAALRLLDELDSVPASGDPAARDRVLAQVEAALFAADEPLSLRRLAQVAGVPDLADARRLVRKLQQLYEQDDSAFQVEELAGGFQLLTRPIFHVWLSSLRRAAQELRLSPAAKETLAIVAYRQPITRADIEAIRGVQCADTLRLLMERGLLRIAGRHDSLGRPVLYGTTKKFLQVFGLRTLKDLPRAGRL